MLERLKDKEMLRIAAAVCIGLVGAQVVTTILRMAFYDRYQGWRFGWMIAAAVVVAAGYWLIPKARPLWNRAVELFSVRRNQVIGYFAVVAIILLYVAIADHFAAANAPVTLDFSKASHIR